MIIIYIELTRDLFRLLDINDQEFLKQEFNAFIHDLKKQNEIDPDDRINLIDDICELPSNEKISLSRFL